MLATYHTHSVFCDGKMMPEEYVLAAIRKGFQAIGFTSHAPVLFGADWTMKPENLGKYIETIQGLKKKYMNRIQVYTGLETDYYPGCIDYRSYPGIDYTIGSIHFIYDEKNDRYLSVDGLEEEYAELINNVFMGDVQAFVSAYFDQIEEMVKKQPPDIVGHIDIIKKNNRNSFYFSENDKWYRDKVEETLNIISKCNITVEVNTGGISRGYTNDLYPSEWMLKLIREMNIPIVLNSDAHHPDFIDSCYNDAVKTLKKMGFTHQRVLSDGLWQNIPLM